MNTWEEGIWESPLAHELAIQHGLVPSPEPRSDATYAFLDESYQHDHYYVAGIIVTGAQLTEIENELAAFLGWDMPVTHGVTLPVDIELHAHPLMQSRKGWEFLGRNMGWKIAICRRVLEIVRECGAVVIIEGIDVTRLNARYRYPQPPHLVTFRHALERIETHVQRTNMRPAQVIADHLDDYPAYLRQIQGYRTNGTPGYRSSKLQGIQTEIKYDDSRAHRGLQVADFVAYFSRRHLEAETSQDRRARQAARKLFSIIEEMASPHCRPSYKWYP